MGIAAILALPNFLATLWLSQHQSSGPVFLWNLLVTGLPTAACVAATITFVFRLPLALQIIALECNALCFCGGCLFLGSIILFNGFALKDLLQGHWHGEYYGLFAFNAISIAIGLRAGYSVFQTKKLRSTS